MARTQYKRNPGALSASKLRLSAVPARQVTVESAGKLSKPKPFRVGSRVSKLPTPRIVDAGGASGTI